MPVLALLFLRVVAHDVAATPLALSDRHLFDAKVLRDLAVATGPGDHLLGDLAAPPQRHAHDVLATPTGERAQVVPLHLTR